ncbi:thioesterase family protein [Streptomyces tauricus]|uniref:thioesterase family protein n=1 Tax=Streptomyces tauricus TaxID=68274 RepID=UPI002242FAC4|nr:thioesterase family protein [Streptomyces tauricus]MCW8103611.1 thioesterase family protein [Streptomyces tauricus]
MNLQVLSRVSSVVTKVFFRSYKVGLSEADFNGHLRSTRYLDYSADVRYAHLVEAGWTLRRITEAGVAPVSTVDELRYLREVNVDETITAAYRLTGASEDGARWQVSVDMTNSDNAVVATVMTTGAWIGLRSRRITAPPTDLAAAVNDLRSDDFVVLENANRPRPPSP